MVKDAPDRFKVPQGFWRMLDLVGLAPRSVLRLARLPASLDLNPKAVLTTAEFFALWRGVEDLTSDPGLWTVLMARLDPAVLPPSALVAFHGRDYRDALYRMARFKQLCTPEIMHVTEEGDDCIVTVEWLYSAGAVPTLLTDVTLASFIELGRRGTGLPLKPRRLELTRADTGRDLHGAYFNCKIRYEAPRDALVLHRSDLDRPFPGHNAELLDMLTPVLASALDALQAQSSTGEQVKVILKRNIASGRPDICDVARELGLSERTLQRRITAEGKTFRQILTEARRDLARQLLPEPSVEIGEVAYLLGYEDTNSFYRAFRLWEGTTPARWRERHS